MTENSSDLWRLDAATLAARIRGKEVSSAEVVDAHLARIEAVNPRLNAVPFTVKENLDVAGTPTTQGLHALAQAISPVDAPVVTRLRDAGGIPIGRTNLPDMGLRVHTDSSLRGLTRNPWHHDRTAGGSSGGEASALASGMTPLGLGNDIGGSLRNPAHCCGITSLKPSAWRMPQAHVVPPEDPFLAAQLMAVDGPMARRVADLRLAFGLLAGSDPRDPFAVDAPVERDDTAARVRVALVAEPPGGRTDAGIAAAVRRAGEALAAAGYDVVEVLPPMYEQSLTSWARILGPDLRLLRPVLDQVMGADALTFLNNAESSFEVLDAIGIGQSHIERHAIARAWSMFMAEHPLVLSPTWALPAFEHGADLAGEAGAAATLETIRPVLPANLLALPVTTVPVGTSDGLPVGVQVIGRRFREDQTLTAAEAIESAVGILTPIDPTW
jgi:amidase